MVGRGPKCTYAGGTGYLPIHSCELCASNVALWLFLVVFTDERVDGEGDGEGEVEVDENGDVDGHGEAEREEGGGRGGNALDSYLNEEGGEEEGEEMEGQHFEAV